jgi:hypothetical protein
METGNTEIRAQTGMEGVHGREELKQRFSTMHK